MDRRELWRRLNARKRDVRFEEIEKLLRLAGWELNNVRGSHHVFRTGDGRHLSVPRHGNLVKTIYVRIVLQETKEPGDE
ncbi:MAG TPA: type II toxin-antitoxin system HicA family toxin [Tepidiformaceae bacterium]|nr:type II toxin-antitoxin system HicA family toxin [Tepidiformaceae bacterium]